MLGYIALVPDVAALNHLKALYPFSFPNTPNHHVTYEFGVLEEDFLKMNLPETMYVCVKQFVKSTEDHIECFLIEVDHDIRRGDGKYYHITWSLNRKAGARPVMSNDILVKYLDGHDPAIEAERIPTYCFACKVEFKKAG